MTHSNRTFRDSYEKHELVFGFNKELDEDDREVYFEVADTETGPGPWIFGVLTEEVARDLYDHLGFLLGLDSPEPAGVLERIANALEALADVESN
jgi:hypothetical protein